MKKLFAIHAFGVKHNKRSRSFTIKSFIGWTAAADANDAKTFAIKKWCALHPKLAAEQISVYQIPTAALFAITSQHAIKAPEVVQ